MGKSRPLFVYFRSFLITISIIQIEKSLGFEPGPQDGRRRQNHGAIAATHHELTLNCNKIVVYLLKKPFFIAQIAA